MKFEFNTETILIIIVLGTLAFATPQGRQFLGLAPGGVAPGEFYYGSAQFKLVQTDYFTGGAVSPTSAVYTLYHVRPRTGVSGTAITASGTTTEIFKADGGKVYMAIYGGTDYYLVEPDVYNSNPRITSHYYEDFDNDGTDELIVELDVSDVGERGQGLTPVVSISLPLVDEDISGLTSDNPADQSSIGTTATTVTITWKVSGLTAEDGVTLQRIYFATNSSRGGDDLRFETLTISGGWTVNGQDTWGAPVHEENGDYEAWYMRPADYLEPHAGTLVWRGTNADDSLYVTVSIRCMFESAEDHLVDLYMDFLDPDTTTISTVNDQVELAST